MLHFPIKGAQKQRVFRKEELHLFPKTRPAPPFRGAFCDPNIGGSRPRCVGGDAPGAMGLGQAEWNGLRARLTLSCACRAASSDPA